MLSAGGTRELDPRMFRVAREGACYLRWLRGFHQSVDWRKEISVIPIEM